MPRKDYRRGRRGRVLAGYYAGARKPSVKQKEDKKRSYAATKLVGGRRRTDQPLPRLDHLLMRETPGQHHEFVSADAAGKIVRGLHAGEGRRPF